MADKTKAASQKDEAREKGPEAPGDPRSISPMTLS
jgi:hypothetical protein